MTLAELLTFAFDAISKIVSAVADAKTERVTPDQAALAIRALLEDLDANNAAADAALAAKFPAEAPDPNAV